ncbi:MAG: hypothetical protein IIA61_10580 [Candidatus Marinimicrobia bacterium]|nr:hypothetical protein [Candidatus Neomarinimicrobiota bacterium]
MIMFDNFFLSKIKFPTILIFTSNLVFTSYISPYSTSKKSGIYFPLLPESQLFKTSKERHLQQVLADIYGLENAKEYHKAYKLGKRTISQVDLKDNAYGNMIALITARVAYKAELPVETILRYFKIYIEINRGFDNRGQALLKEMIRGYSEKGDVEKLLNILLIDEELVLTIVQNAIIGISNESIRKKIEGINFLDLSTTEKLKILVELSPNNASNKFLLAIEYINQKQYQQAEELFLSDKESLTEIGNLLAMEYFKQKLYKEAEQIFLANKTKLNHKNGLYLLISQANLYSYTNALEKFNQNYTYFIANENKVEDVWKLVSKLFTEQLFSMEVIEATSSINDQSKRFEALCIANYFIGLKFFYEGNNTIATQYFSQAVSTGKNNLIEYKLAKEQLDGTFALNTQIDETQKTIAVVDFEGNGISQSEARIITNRLTSELIKRNTFIVLERAQMDEILKEQGFQQSGCVSSECLVEVGKLLGMQFMLTGSVGRFGNLNIIELRIVDIETGKIVKSATYDFEGEKELLLSSGIRMSLTQLLQ